MFKFLKENFPTWKYNPCCRGKRQNRTQMQKNTEKKRLKISASRERGGTVPSKILEEPSGTTMGQT